MKHTLLSTFPLLAVMPLALLSAVPAFAEDFTIRAVPAGLDRVVSLSSFLPPMDPIAADVLGNGRLQWYMGGNVITQFPAPGTITLPADFVADEKCTLRVDFVCKMYNASGLEVDRLAFRNIKYKPAKGVRHVAKAGIFEVRCG